jgi:hypothetical protein
LGATEGQRGGTPRAANRAKTVAAGLGGALAGIALLLLVLWKSGVFEAHSTPPTPVLIKNDHAPAPILAKTDEPPPPVLAKPTDVVKMPDDIFNWLKHLEKIEKQKKELLRRQIAEMKVFEQMVGALGAGIGMTNPYDQADTDPKEDKDPGEVTQYKFDDLKPDWATLLQDFESVPPPPECQKIANEYETGLEAVPNMIGEVNAVFSQVSTDPNGALKKMNEMQNRSYAEIDQPFANSDVDVQYICDEYKTPKWFNIGDAGGSLFSK